MQALLVMRMIPHLVLAFVAIPVWGADIQAPGVSNFHQVNDHVYRGAQPTEEGWKSLAQLGVKTIIDLRRQGEHPIEAEGRAAAAAGMRYINVPMQGIAAPSDEQVAKVLQLLDSSEPVFVHCKLGKDRTGTVIACYRIKHDGWQNEKALQEAKSYGLHSFELGMKRYVLAFQSAREGSAGGRIVASR